MWSNQIGIAERDALQRFSATPLEVQLIHEIAQQFPGRDEKFDVGVMRCLASTSVGYSDFENMEKALTPVFDVMQRMYTSPYMCSALPKRALEVFGNLLREATTKQISLLQSAVAGCSEEVCAYLEGGLSSWLDRAEVARALSHDREQYEISEESGSVTLAAFTSFAAACPALRPVEVRTSEAF